MRALTITALAMLAAAPAAAMSLPKPTGPVVLTVTGAIDNVDADGKAEFDMAMLEALEQKETTTATPWYDGKVTFKGPLATTLLEAVGAHGDTVHVTAINDYSADIPVTDFANDPVIFATHINGEPMSVRDKGPIFVVYPFDENPNLYNEAFFGKSVWQVVSLDVR
jgi:hypothetical protein